jgi:hypothetical protein
MQLSCQFSHIHSWMKALLLKEVVYVKWFQKPVKVGSFYWRSMAICNIELLICIKFGHGHCYNNLLVLASSICLLTCWPRCCLLKQVSFRSWCHRGWSCSRWQWPRFSWCLFWFFCGLENFTEQCLENGCDCDHNPFFWSTIIFLFDWILLCKYFKLCSH